MWIALGIILFGTVGIAGIILYSLRAPTFEKRTIRVGGQPIAVDVADTPLTRMVGLSGRDTIGADGMLFLFASPGSYGFWMKGMRFPIDIAWIQDDRVVGVEERVPASAGWRIMPRFYYPPEPVSAVLELSAGDVKKRGITVGTDVVL